MTDLVARLRIEAEARQATGNVREFGQEVDRAGGKGRAAKSGFDAAAAGASNFERQATGANTAARALAAGLAAIGARELAQQITDAAFQAQGFTTGLSAVAGGAAGAREETAFLRGEAERLGLVVRDQTAGFMSLAGATDGTRLAGEQTREVWLGLAEAGAALNRSSEQQSRALEAVAQIAGKGVVSMEEIRGQLAEAIPGAVRIAADAMDMTTAKFIEVVSEGKLLSEDFLPKFAAELRTRFGPALEEALNSPLGQARREIAETKNAMFDLQVAAGEGFLQGAIEGVREFNAEISSPEARQAARELGQDLGELFSVGAQGAAVLADNIDLVVIAAQALVGLAVARWAGDLATSAREAALRIREKAAAHLAAAQAANLEARANLTASASGLTYAQRSAAAAAAARNLAAAQSSTAAASLAMRGALSGVLGFLGGTWGVALLAAGGAVAYLTGQMAEAEEEARILERGLDLAAQRSQGTDDASRALAAGLDMAAASADAAAGASRRHASALWDEQKAALAAALAVAQKNVASARQRTTDTSPLRFGFAEDADGGAGFAASQERARQELYRAELNLKKLEEAYNRLQQDSASRSKGVGGERARLAREEAAGVVEAAAQVARAHQDVEEKAKKRARVSDEVREAERRLAAAKDIIIGAELETEALRRRAEAALEGEAALERVAIQEAGLQVLNRLGVKSLEELTGAVRDQAAAAIAAAEARERQAIATEKAERVGATLRDLDRQIAAERARTVAIQGGIKAEVDYAKAEAVRQAVERAGANLTEEQIEQIRRKVELLFQVQAANDNATARRDQERELELLQLTNREREIEIRAREKATRLMREGLALTEEEARLRGRLAAMEEVDAEERNRAIGTLREDLRRAFVESGEIGFDQIADYAERKLREAVYDALLAEPIDIIIRATVGSISGLTGGGLGGAGGGGGLLGSLLGSTGLGSLLGSASMGSALANLFGVQGSGNRGIDLLAGAGGAALTGLINGTAMHLVGSAVMGLGSSLGLGASAAIGAGVGASALTGAILGPLGALAGIALAGLFKDDKRPYARTDFGVVNGQFAVTGGQQLDQGPLDKTNQAAEQIVASLNAAAELFKLDLTKISGNLGSFGYVQGKNTGNLGQGWFGGGGGGFSGAEFSGSQDPEKLAADIVKSTILKAIEAGASDLSEAEKNVVRQAADLEEAATKIAAGRSIMDTIDQAILQLTDPAAFERKQALDAIEANYKALKAKAEELIAAGLVPADVLAKIEELKVLQTADALEKLGEAAGRTAEQLTQDVQDGILKILDPQRYKLVTGQRQIDDDTAAMRAEAEKLIAAGKLDPGILAQIEQLRGLRLAELAEAVDGSAEAFRQLAPRLRQWLDISGLSASAELSPQAARDEALRQYTQQLAKAQGGDAEAAANLTAYADRLLELDRQATDDAQARLALYNQVRGQIAGVASMAESYQSPQAVMAELTKALEKVFLDPVTGFLASNDNGQAVAPKLTLANVPELKAMYGDVMGKETDRQLAAIEKLQAALETRLSALEGATTSELKQTREVLAQAMAAIDAGLAAAADAASAGAQATGDLARVTEITNAFLRGRARAA